MHYSKNNRWIWLAVGLLGPAIAIWNYCGRSSSGLGPLPLHRSVKAASRPSLRADLVGAQSFLLEWRSTAFRQEAMDDFYNLIDKDAPLVLTIHALYEPPFDNSYGANLNATTSGKYDEKIQQLAKKLKAHRAPVYLRWCEAMEADSERYPWQLMYHKLYTDAYRHFVSTARSVNPALKFIWGPAGYPGLVEYWPGPAYVDAISLDIDHPSELGSDTYPPYRSITEQLYRKVHRLRFYDQPIVVFALEDKPQDVVAQALSEAMQAREAIAHVPVNTSNVPMGSEGFKIGVYDPKDRLTSLEGVTVEHLFVNWAHLDSGPFRAELEAVLSRGHEVIVTAEPFKDAEANHDRQVLANMQNGQYDAYIEALYDVLAETGQTVYLRFAHEMEIPIERYPWQSQDPIDYIMAYRYFMEFRQPFPEHIRRVWGPAGDRGSMDFYPGDDVVDLVSVAIYGLPDKNITDYKQQESFERIFNRKRHRVALANKPLFITEFGVKGPEDFQAYWLREAAQVLKPQKGEIYGACYFNLYDNPDVWGEGIPAPDWSVEKATFRAFITALSGGRNYN